MAKVHMGEFLETMEVFLKAELREDSGGDYAITGLPVANINKAKLLTTPPRYILTASELPAVKIHFMGITESSLETGDRIFWTYAYSVFYYRLQVPGQDHQELLIADLKKIVDSINEQTDSYRLDEFVATNQTEQQLQLIWATNVIMHEELKFEIDCPELRISVGEVVIEIKSQSGLSG